MNAENNAQSGDRPNGTEEKPGDPKRSQFLSLPQMRYPGEYVWLVFVSTLDLILTMLVLFVWNGYEANPVAAGVIMTFGYQWAIVFKYAIVVLVIIFCEVIGRRDNRSGISLARGAVAITAIPVIYTLILLLIETRR